MKPLKQLPLKNTHNTRDLGGYPTTDGCMTRWGLLYRSDSLAKLDEEDWHFLQQRNIHTIIDLRNMRETESAPIEAPEGIRTFHFSLMNTLDQNPETLSQENILASMKLDYVQTLFGNLPCAADILRTISEGMKTGSVLFLCSAGKDRTGTIAALILYLCQVSRQNIIADYMVSSTYNADGINRMLKNLPEHLLKRIPDMKLLEDCFASKPETVTALLDALDARNISQELDRVGFSFAQQAALKEQFTEHI